MSREDGILVAAFGIVATFLFLIAVLATLGFSATAAAWVQAIGSVAAIFVAIGVLWIQNRSTLSAECRATDERARVVRACIAAEIEVLLGAMKPAISWEDNGLDSPIVALLVVGTLNIHVYHAIIPQLGELGSELAADVVSEYATLENVIQRAQKMQRDLKTTDQIDQSDSDARDWLGSLQRVAERMPTTLIELRSPDDLAQT